MKPPLMAVSVLCYRLTFSNDYVTLIQNVDNYKGGVFIAEIIY